MVPQIRCPNCGITINLENRRRMDFGMIIKALQKKPKTFTDLLHITGLPRKTLSLRLKHLIKSGAIAHGQDGDYRLNGSAVYSNVLSNILDDKTPLHDNRNVRKLLHLRKNVLIALLLLCIGLPVAAKVYAIYTTPKPTPPEPPVASFLISPDPPYYVDWMQRDNLTFDASASYSSNASIVAYGWRFGDGTEARGMVVSHVYRETGTLTVRLTVFDDNGLRSTARKQVTVLPTPCMKLYVEPPEITGLTIGDVFTVNIVVSEVTDLAAWQCGMTFNPEILECIPVEYNLRDELSECMPEYNWTGDDWEEYQGLSAFEEGPFLRQGGETLFVAPQPIYGEEGVIRFHGCSIFTNFAPVSGSGTLAYVTFKVIGSGASELHLTDLALLNPDIEEIPIFEIGDGYFESP